MTPTIDTPSAAVVAFPETLDAVRAYVETLDPLSTIRMGSPSACLGAQLLAYANRERVEREGLQAYWIITSGSLDHTLSRKEECISILGTPVGDFFRWLFDYGLVRRRATDQIAPGHDPIEEYWEYEETSEVAATELLAIIEHYRTSVLLEDPTHVTTR